jgi:hypothetical protein
VINPSPGWQRMLAANLLLLAVYAIVGRFCLYLSLAPGYASPLFLPAGIAMASAVTFGPRLLPGVAIGAVLINFLPLPGAPNPLSLPPWPQGIAALAAGAASALQAWLGMLYFRRAIRPEVGAGRDVLRFLLLAVCVTLVSSTLSNGVAVAVGAIARQDWLTSWLTWWIGDAIGVLLAAPLCWVLFGQPRALWRRRRLLVGLPQLMLVTLCVMLYVLVARWETRQHLEGFRLKAQQVGDLLQARFSEHERYALAMARAINRYGRVMSAQGFDKIAHGYLDQRPELLSMAWLRPVSAEERPAFDAWAREKIHPDFRVIAPSAGPGHTHRHDGRQQPAMPPGEHMVTLFIEPAERRHYEGLDWLAEPVRAQAVRAALRSGKPVASAPVLLSLPGEGSGVVLLQAVDPGDGQPAVGMLMLAMQIDSYVHAALADADFPHMRARLVDRGTPGPTTLVDQLPRAPSQDDYWRRRLAGLGQRGGRPLYGAAARLAKLAGAERGPDADRLAGRADAADQWRTGPDPAAGEGKHGAPARTRSAAASHPGQGSRCHPDHWRRRLAGLGQRGGRPPVRLCAGSAGRHAAGHPAAGSGKR